MYNGTDNHECKKQQWTTYGDAMIYKWAHCQTQLLNELIPNGVRYGEIEETPAVYDEETGELITPAVTRQKTLREFIFDRCTFDLVDGTTVLLLACDQKKHGRDKGVDAQDLMDWNGFLTPYGHGEDTWLDTAAALELRDTIGVVG